MRIDFGNDWAIDRLMATTSSGRRFSLLRVLIKEALNRWQTMPAVSRAALPPGTWSDRLGSTRIRVLVKEEGDPDLARFLLEQGAVSSREKSAEIRLLLEWHLATSATKDAAQVAGKSSTPTVVGGALQPTQSVAEPASIGPIDRMLEGIGV